jgi:Ser-tRNA(Ala) deacylase AlaX
MHEIVSFVKNALEKGRRVIIEHFELLYPALGMNAEIMIGIGEEIIVTRPYVFGPFPKDIANIVHASLKYRKMAHTAEEVVMMVLGKEYDSSRIWKSSDIKKGFILVFNKKPEIDPVELEKKAKDIISLNLDVAYYDESHIKFGDFEPVPCSGPRIHVKNTAEIEAFRIINHITHDSLNNTYLLVGLIGSGDQEGFSTPNVF